MTIEVKRDAMTLKETITREFLDAVDDPAGLDEVFRRYGHSKGPLYSALAEATALLKNHLTSLQAECTKTEEECREQQQQAERTQTELTRLQGEQATRTEELAAIEEKVNQKKRLLDQAEALGGLGFGLNELSRLHDLLARIAASQGMKPGEAVASFFEKMKSYGNIVSLELETKRAEVATGKAKAEAERWRAEAQAAEAKCQARKTSIDVTEKMVAHGVKEADLPHWTRVLAKAGVAPEKLGQTLEQYGAVEKLCQDRQEQAEKLEVQARQLRSEIKALNEERQELTAAVSTVSTVTDEALSAIGRASQKALEHVEALANKGKEYGALERMAGQLEQELALAQALKSQDPKLWQQVAHGVVRELLKGLVIWARADASHNPVVAVPSFVSSRYYLYSLGGLQLVDLLLWALGGAFTEEERRALDGRQ